MDKNIKAAADHYISKIKEAANLVDTTAVAEVFSLLERARKTNKNIFIFGNGGSAAGASHIACDINKCGSEGKKPRYKMVCLNECTATMLAYANDMSYEHIFAEQLGNLLNPGDVVIGISTSGNSPNVIKAIEFANKNKGITVGICAYNGGKLKKAARHVIHVPVNNVQIAEDLNLVIGHILMTAAKSL